MDQHLVYPSYTPPDFLFKDVAKTEFPLIYKNKPLDFILDLPLVIIHLGPSGAGKDVSAELALADGVVVHAVTATSRLRRVAENESDSKYVWMRQKRTGESLEEYDAHLIQEYELIEHDRHFGGLYGLPKQSIHDALKIGIPLIRTEPRGAKTIISKLKNEFNFVVTFVVPESFEQLISRIEKRGNIEERITKAVEEIEEAPEVTNYYLYNPVEYNGRPGLAQIQQSFRDLILSLRSNI